MKSDPENIDQKLLVLYLLGEISQEGRQKVESWLNSSGENRAYFESMEKTWIATGRIDPVWVQFDSGKAWAKMLERIEQDEGGINKSRGRGIAFQTRANRFVMLAAAVLMLGIVSVVLTLVLRNRVDSGPVILASSSEVVQDTLSDGSSVVLNSDTKLIIPKKFAEATRTVELTGEAFFEVTPDSLKPFIVKAGPGQIKVLGTSFHVKAYPGSDLDVYVETGRVELSAPDSITGDTLRILLKAGERGMIGFTSGEIRKAGDMIPDELFWVNKKLIFQETKLSLVFDLLRKHYNADIEVKEDAVLNCLLSATFTDESIGQILEVVAASFELKVSRDEDKYIINGKGCGHEDE
jgi:ferric-dicitrate binding protein FerR (iron transport regulator)